MSHSTIRRPRAGSFLATLGLLLAASAASGQEKSSLEAYCDQHDELVRQYVDAHLAGDTAKKAEIYEKMKALELEMPAAQEQHEHGGTEGAGGDAPEGEDDHGLGMGGDEPHGQPDGSNGTDLAGGLENGMGAQALSTTAAKKAEASIESAVKILTAKLFVELARQKMGAEGKGKPEGTEIRIVDEPTFARAWEDFCDRRGKPGARQPAGMNAFVDDTLSPHVAFVRKGKDIGTLIHESLHLRTSSGFASDAKNGKDTSSLNEGVTEFLTRMVIAHASLNISRNVYPEETQAVMNLVRRTGEDPIAKWYFDGDSAPILAKLGTKRAAEFESWKKAMKEGRIDDAKLILD